MYKFTHPAGGKTGTTQNWTDAWFVGYSPYLAAGVWFGVDDPKVSLGSKQDGSRAALPAWARFMRAAHDSMGWKHKDFPQPDGISKEKICTVSKDFPTRYCPVEEEFFITKYAPTRSCRIHTEGSPRRERERSG
jgi:penicillin-binding protein 1A